MSIHKCDSCGIETTARVHVGTNVYCNRCFGLANTSQPTPSDDGKPITHPCPPCYRCGEQASFTCLACKRAACSKCMAEYPAASYWCVSCARGTLSTSDDDGEPITAAWMIEEYGDDVLWLPCDNLSPVVICSDEGSVRINVECGNWPLPHIRTRGQLRQLLAALGWRGEGEG